MWAIPAVLWLPLSACDDSLGLPNPAFANRVDTITLYALNGTPIRSPSAYDVVTASASRTERGDAFDFAFNIDEDGVAVILPPGAMGGAFPKLAGVLLSSDDFESIQSAPLEEYVPDSAIVIEESSVFVVQSRPERTPDCLFLGALPRYGKFRVITLDPLERSVTLELLVDLNCGYRGLEPGFPTS